MKMIVVVTALALASSAVLGAARADLASHQPTVLQLVGSPEPVRQMQHAAMKEILKEALNAPPATESPPKNLPKPGDRGSRGRLIPYNGVNMHTDRHIIMCPPGTEYKPRIGKCEPSGAGR